MNASRKLLFGFLLCFCILYAGSLTNISPAIISVAASTTIQTVNPSAGFTMDNGPATFSFSASKFSWAQGTSNITLNVPSLTVAVANTACAIAQASAFSHNTTTYTWTFSGAAACNGAALTTSMTMYVSNTSAYNQKEVIIKGSTTKAGGGNIANAVNFPLTFTGGSPSNCDQNTNCTQVSVGTTSFSWSQISSFSPIFNNNTHILNVSTTATASAVTSYLFDPIATDGSGNNQTATVTMEECKLSTSITHDTIILFDGTSTTSTFSSISDTAGLSWTQRNRATEASGSAHTEFEYYAKSTAVLTNDVIKFTITGSTGQASVCFGISGADQNTVFDSNAAATSHNSTTSSVTTMEVTNSSTSNANDMIIIGAVWNSGGTFSSSTGFSIISSNNGGPSIAAGDQVVSATQSNPVWSLTKSTGSASVAIVDAVMQNAAFSTTLSPTISLSPSLTEDLTNSIATSIALSPSLNQALTHGLANSISLSPGLTATTGGGSSLTLTFPAGCPRCQATVTQSGVKTTITTTGTFDTGTSLDIIADGQEHVWNSISENIFFYSLAGGPIDGSQLLTNVSSSSITYSSALTFACTACDIRLFIPPSSTLSPSNFVSNGVVTSYTWNQPEFTAKGAGSPQEIDFYSPNSGGGGGIVAGSGNATSTNSTAIPTFTYPSQPQGSGSSSQDVFGTYLPYAIGIPVIITLVLGAFVIAKKDFDTKRSRKGIKVQRKREVERR